MVRTTDNEPLAHSSKNQIQEADPDLKKAYKLLGHDNEIYFSMACDGCNHEFKKSMLIIERL